MEVRKIQVTGAGDTRIISLPKEWTERHRLNKGSNVIIKELSTGDLIIYPQKSPIESQKRTTRIIESGHVSRDILAAYLLGSDIITVVSKDRDPLARKGAIKDLSRQLIGLEILGETQQRIELHFLIDSSSLPNPREYVRRCFSIANQMQQDVVTAFLNSDISLAEEVIERDVEVNRLYFLIVRMLKIMVDDKREISYLKSTACLDWRMVATFSEDLGDASVEFARMVKKYPNMNETILPGTLKKIDELSKLTTEVLNKSLDYFLEQNVEEAEELKNTISTKLNSIHEEIQKDISMLNKEVVWKLSSLLNLFKELRETAIDIGDLIIAHDTSFDIPNSFHE
ncbi:MAG: PhoU domain-containing protein [Candidatus Hodarchaeota archaeon]